LLRTIVPGTPILEENFTRVAFEEQRMDQSPFRLDRIRRDAVLRAIQQVCAYRGWNLLAAHVRSNHVGAPRHHTMDVETAACLGGDAVRSRRAR
jgi:hypothetical protein